MSIARVVVTPKREVHKELDRRYVILNAALKGNGGSWQITSRTTLTDIEARTLIRGVLGHPPQKQPHLQQDAIDTCVDSCHISPQVKLHGNEGNPPFTLKRMLSCMHTSPRESSFTPSVTFVPFLNTPRCLILFRSISKRKESLGERGPGGKAGERLCI